MTLKMMLVLRMISMRILMPIPDDDTGDDFDHENVRSCRITSNQVRSDQIRSHQVSIDHMVITEHRA